MGGSLQADADSFGEHRREADSATGRSHLPASILVSAVPLAGHSAQLGAYRGAALLWTLAPVAHPARAPVVAGEGPLPPATAGTGGPAGCQIGQIAAVVAAAEVHCVVGDFA